MKKAISVILILMMLGAMAIPSLASEPVTVTITTVTATEDEAQTSDGSDVTDGTISIPVKGDFDDQDFDPDEVPANYYVLLTWNVTSTLTYNVDASTYRWAVRDENGRENTDAAFEGPYEAGYDGHGYWTGDAEVQVSIENRSNRALTATLSYADADAAEGTGIIEDIDTSTVRSFDAGSYSAKWAAAADPVNGGILSLRSAAEGVEADAGAAAENKDEAGATMNINTQISLDATDHSTMEGAISRNDITIGTLTVTIAKAS